MYVYIYTRYSYVRDRSVRVARQRLAPSDQWHQHNKFSDNFGIWMFIASFTKARRLLIVNPMCNILRRAGIRKCGTVSVPHKLEDHSLSTVPDCICSTVRAIWSLTFRSLNTTRDIQQYHCPRGMALATAAGSVLTAAWQLAVLSYPHCTYIHINQTLHKTSNRADAFY
jgi:hypothetical protein